MREFSLGMCNHETKLNVKRCVMKYLTMVIVVVMMVACVSNPTEVRVVDNQVVEQDSVKYDPIDLIEHATVESNYFRTELNITIEYNKYPDTLIVEGVVNDSKKVEAKLHYAGLNKFYAQWYMTEGRVFKFDVKIIAVLGSDTSTVRIKKVLVEE